jgi:hypothetical protein
MSGTFPTAGFTTMDFQSNISSKTTRSISGKTQRIKTGGQYWSFKLQSPSLNRGDFFSQYSFIVQQEGQVESFTIVPPVISSTRGTATGTVTISDDYSAGVTNCRSTGGSGSLKKGDLIKFSNHDKVYMLTSDINLDQLDSSEDVITFYPALTTAITSTTTITYNNVPFTVYFDTDILSFSTGADGSYRYQITCNEEI